MREAVRKILDLLSPREKRTGTLVLGLVLLMALLETAGVASVMPFLAVLANPEVVETNEYLRRAYGAFGSPDRQTFLIALGVASFTVVVFAALLKLGTLYALHRWANMRRHSVSCRLLALYLRQPYEFFLDRNTADLSKTILSEVDELTEHVFKPGIQLIAYATTALALVLFLFVVDALIAAALLTVVAGSYALIYLGVRGILERVGRDRAAANRERYIAAGEVLGGIKDIKVLGREEVYLSRFVDPSARASRHQATMAVLSLVPKHVIEAVGFGGVLALAVVLLATRGDLVGTLPILGLYAFAGYRLLPSAQQVFAALAKLRFGKAAVDVVHDDLAGLGAARGRTETRPRGEETEAPLRILRRIRLAQVSYTYPGASMCSLHSVDIEIPRHSSLGIVGGTGAGKTTLVDILLGLLPPSEGQVLVDGRSLEDVGLRRWQRSIGYVPQHIFLADASVTENIALGVDPEGIDADRVEAAARAAQIHGFINALAQRYDTMVGERGVRMSGGQRQRLGIARALYHGPELLVLDEATNALDAYTENQVMEAVARLQESKTLVVVAHRVRTVRRCDQILVLEEGKMRGLGGFEELERSNEAFRKVAVG